jgi:hypothetical protein
LERFKNVTCRAPETGVAAARAKTEPIRKLTRATFQGRAVIHPEAATIAKYNITVLPILISNIFKEQPHSAGAGL